MTTQPVHAPLATNPGPAWLRSGAVAGPAFLAVSLLQVPLKDGFDLTRHAFSFLALGDQGWVQQLNFVVTGILFGLAAVQLRRRLAGRLRRVAVASGVLMGGGMALAGIFRVDPSFGFPQGAPEGLPDQMSLNGALHGLGFAVSMTAWVVLLVALGLAVHRSGHRATARTCFTAAAALPLVPALGGTPFGTVYLYVVASAAFVLTSVTLMRVNSGRISLRASREGGR